MDPNALYAALNTVAQCAAALAALIGFPGLWRLDRLRDEERRAAARWQNPSLLVQEALARWLAEEV